MAVALVAVAIAFAIPQGQPDGFFAKLFFYLFYFPLRYMDLAAGIVAGAVAGVSLGPRRLGVVVTTGVLAGVGFTATLVLAMASSGYSIAMSRMFIVVALSPVGAGVAFAWMQAGAPKAGAMRGAALGVLLLAVLCILAPALLALVALSGGGGIAAASRRRDGGHARDVVLVESEDRTSVSGHPHRQQSCSCGLGLGLGLGARYCSGCGVRLSDGIQSPEWFVPALPGVGVWLLAGAGFVLVLPSLTSRGGGQRDERVAVRPAYSALVPRHTRTPVRPRPQKSRPTLSPTRDRITPARRSKPLDAGVLEGLKRHRPGDGPARNELQKGTAQANAPSVVVHANGQTTKLSAKARALVSDAENAYLDGDFRVAMRVAMRAYALGKSTHALSIAVKAACRRKDHLRARRYLAKLPSAMRAATMRVCRGYGVAL